MCDKITGTAIADRDITVWKLARALYRGVAQSQYDPWQRRPIGDHQSDPWPRRTIDYHDAQSRGSVLLYKAGERTHGWPMVYAEYRRAIDSVCKYNEVVLRCTIPAGTRYMIGEMCGSDVLIPEYVDVIGGQ